MKETDGNGDATGVGASVSVVFVIGVKSGFVNFDGALLELLFYLLLLMMSCLLLLKKFESEEN